MANNIDENLTPPSLDWLPQKKTPRERLVSFSLLAILLLTAGLYALLILHDNLPLFALILLALIWALNIFVDRSAIQLTPLHVPILALLILLPINLFISPDRPLTLIRIYHLLLSFSLFFVIIRLVQFRKHLPSLILILVFLSIGAGLLGLFATEWSGGVLGFLAPVYEKIPRLSSLIPSASINKNTMGGALTFFPPLLFSLLWDGGKFKKLAAKYAGFNKIPILFYKLLVFFALTLTLGVIFLTQSRSAWLGTAAGIFVFLIWKDKRFLWAIPLGAFALVFVMRQSGIGGLPELFALLDRGQDASLQGRVDIWVRIISMVRDFPLTGVGLDALNPVFQSFFNPFLFNEPPATLFHAHNTLLSVTIEMGIPALILYVALLSAFVVMAKRVWKGARTINRVLIMGLVCGMISHQVFGLMDAYPLGKNLGITMWIYFSVMTALYVHRSQMVRSQPQPQDQQPASHSNGLIQQFLRGLAAWLVLSLLALAVLRVNVDLSLIVAILSGVYMGVWLVKTPIPSVSRKHLPVISSQH